MIVSHRRSARVLPNDATEVVGKVAGWGAPREAVQSHGGSCYFSGREAARNAEGRRRPADPPHSTSIVLTVRLGWKLT